MNGDITQSADLLAEVGQLKRLPRTGWLLRGIGPADCESVAEHTYGVAMVALFLAPRCVEPVDLSRLLSMCLIHDLAEARIGDLTPRAVSHLPPGAKKRAEEAALGDMLAGAPDCHDLQDLWQDFQAGSTIEARLARDADRLDMLLQADFYERCGNDQMDEFWHSSESHQWETTPGQQLYRYLLQQKLSRLEQA